LAIQSAFPKNQCLFLGLAVKADFGCYPHYIKKFVKIYKNILDF